ncbi:S8 family peptidase [Brevibacillus brevis]|uniref:S8 family peptidase n=1 Tax=Brevibacillus brevis TaxID=1393 RepID=UPI00165E38ED|nr:S8 family peptidase [Brevibacillus brevis]
MGRENNFLLGNGTRLTEKVKINGGGGSKTPPYDFITARSQMTEWIKEATNHFSLLPAPACPFDQVTAVLTIHPRYISKSDYPKELINEIGLKAVGGRSRKIKPKSWGVEKHPEEALTDEIFVMGTRDNLNNLYRLLPSWTEEHAGSSQLTQIELFNAYLPAEKLKSLPEHNDEILMEVVLHGCSDKDIIGIFEDYVLKYVGKPILERLTYVKDLAFIPVYTSLRHTQALANFSYLRVARPMPKIRTTSPELEHSNSFSVTIPEIKVIEPSFKAAIFDGGIPKDSPIMNWVNLIEPEDIASPLPEHQEHGLSVTSAFLFGPINEKELLTPLCEVDHIRVLDENTGLSELECYDVLERITKVLDEKIQKEEPYQYVNISVGPDIPIDDNEITLWTAKLDKRFSKGKTLSTIAAGNNGKYDSMSGLNRIQPPSDAVNVLTVGACDSESEIFWQRAEYSSIGPGRCPGIIKPDGVIFGGSDQFPFMVVAPTKEISTIGKQGTSLAAPYALRTAVAVNAQLGSDFNLLTTRALMIHRAEQDNNSKIEVGWGRFESDYSRLITCDDDEVLVVYKGELPVKEHLRAQIPLPDGELFGDIYITATLVISPEVEPDFPNLYTRGGLEVVFRPDIGVYKTYKDGKESTTPSSKSFFNPSNIYGKSEYELRDEDYKWEPCIKATRKIASTALNNPCFDIYYHNRITGETDKSPKPIDYALVVSVKAPEMRDFYARVIRAYQNILVPVQPKIKIQIKPNK